MYVHMYVCMKVCHGLPGSFRIWVCQRLSKYHRFARWCQKTFGLIETVKLPWVCQGLSKYCAFARAVKILWVCQGLSKSYGCAMGCQNTMGTMGLAGVVKIPSGCHGLSKYYGFDSGCQNIVGLPADVKIHRVCQGLPT